MAADSDVMEQIAGKVQAALESADLTELAEEAIGRAEELLQIDRPTDCYLMVGVGGANAVQQSLCSHPQHFIPRQMTQRIVDFFKSIEVDVQQRQMGPAATGQSDRLLDSIVEQDSIGQVGQMIMQRQVLKLIRQLTCSRHIVTNHDGADHTAQSIMNGRGRDFHGHRLAIAPYQYAARGCGSASLIFDDGLGGGARCWLARLGIDQLENHARRQTRRFGLNPSGQALRCLVQVRDMAAKIRAHDGIAD